MCVLQVATYELHGWPAALAEFSRADAGWLSPCLSGPWSAPPMDPSKILTPLAPLFMQFSGE